MAKNTPLLQPVHSEVGVTGRGKFNIHTGQVWATRNFGNVEVVSLPEKGINPITVKFLTTGNITTVQTSSLVRGTIKDKLFGVGYNSKGSYGTTGKYHKCYDYWKTMIMRSYSFQYSEEHPTYKDVYVCEEWLDYQNFAKWYYCQDYIQKGYNLDKDLLQIDNLEYSPNTCCFLPQEINKAITVRKEVRGYTYHKRDEVYESTYRSEYLGRSCNYSLKGLQKLYICARHRHVRSLAHKYKNVLPENVLKVLSEYTCEVDNNNHIRRVK